MSRLLMYNIFEPLSIPHALTLPGDILKACKRSNLGDAAASHGDVEPAHLSVMAAKMR